MATKGVGVRPEVSFQQFVESINVSTKSAVGNKNKELLSLTLKESTSDGSSLKEKLLNPTPESSATLSSYLQTQLDLSRSGEAVLFLGAHNLNSTSSLALFDDDSVRTPSATFSNPSTAFPLTKDEVIRIRTAFEGIAEDINAHATVLWDPLEHVGEKTYLEKYESARNEEETVRNWEARCLIVLVRKVPEGAFDLSEVRIAAVGNVDSGKSTLLGVLTKGRLDDGRGRARVALARHQHEIESGRTSSVGMEIMAYDTRGADVLPPEREGGKAGKAWTWEEICARGKKIVSFIDLAGHEKYLKTTIFGLTGCEPQGVLLIVGANAGIIGMSKEHLSCALALSLPVICVVTKVDSTPAHITAQTLKQLSKILRSPGCRRSPVFVQDKGMAIELAGRFMEERAAPIFVVSNVTGEGLGNLRAFLNVFKDGKERYDTEKELEFQVSDVFSVPFVGTVVSGVILSGRVSVGDTVLLGPDSLGSFMTSSVKSIQRKRVNVEHAEAGQSVSFALKRVRRNMVRKGMAVIAKSEAMPKPVRRFEGQVLVLYHNSTITTRYQSMLHVGPVRQTVKILKMDKEFIRTGDKATVVFEFLKQPEFVKVGQKILFREGKTKGLGVITKVLD
ncbi:P-loop containing nucleoside triphosphate hydrolase protein [Atractiella rhizophila]|nr:P-loop containing nucleoside triphosphate hydrolase protein [Atractiella rhizophila]